MHEFGVRGDTGQPPQMIGLSLRPPSPSLGKNQGCPLLSAAFGPCLPSPVSASCRPVPVICQWPFLGQSPPYTAEMEGWTRGRSWKGPRRQKQEAGPGTDGQSGQDLL